MKTASAWIALPAVVLVIVAFGWMQSRRQHTELVSRLGELRDVEKQVAQARSDNVRLQQSQVSMEELERLRADHAALPRLRKEISDLVRSVDTLEKR